jgi:hypothetical protein
VDSELTLQNEPDADDIRDEVVRLRIQGHGAPNIAKIVGISEKRVYTIFKSEFSRFGNRQQMIEQSAMTLDYLKRPLLKKYEKDALVGKPDRRDAEMILKIEESKRKMFALDQPSRLEVTHYEALDDQSLLDELRKYGISLPQLTAAKEAKKDDVIDAEFTVTEQVESDTSDAVK